MVAFLTDAWLAELDRAAASQPLAEPVDLVVQQVVLGDQGVAFAYVIRIASGTVSVAAGHAADADVSFTQDRATAAAIAQGSLSAQVAFMAGRLRVGGDLRAIIDRSRELAALDDLFAAARAVTTW